MKKLDLTGQRFGRLIVVEEIGISKHGRIIWKCQCDCGNEHIAISNNLRNGDTKSCGCYRKENPNRITHNETRTKLYRVWQNAKNRCCRLKDKSYKHYGGRGIQMCDEWRNDFVAFRDWAYLNGYQDGLEIDRIDNDSDYCPENCQWVTEKTQANNRRNNHPITFNGKTQNIVQWTEELGIGRSIIKNRIRLGWSIEDALTKPVRRIFN